MAEPFGILSGAVGIAAAFTACVDCFGYIQLGRHFGRDFQTDALALNCARLRLTRWGQAVDIYTDPKLGHPDASATELQTLRDTLQQILVLFADSEKISKRYRLNAKPGSDNSVFSTNDMDPAVLAVSNKMKDMALQRRKGSSVIRLTSWALYHRSESKELIANITLLIDNVEKLFPAPLSKTASLVKEETAAIHAVDRDKKGLRLVEDAAEGIDKLLQLSAREIINGHDYSDVVIMGKAQTGDSYSEGWTGQVTGASHKYNGVEVGRDGRALIGNKFGGKDLWDD